MQFSTVNNIEIHTHLYTDIHRHKWCNAVILTLSSFRSYISFCPFEHLFLNVTIFSHLISSKNLSIIQHHKKEKFFKWSFKIPFILATNLNTKLDLLDIQSQNVYFRKVFTLQKKFWCIKNFCDTSTKRMDW